MPTLVLNGHPTWGLLPKKGGTPVVLLHGGHSSSVSLLNAVGPLLSKHYRIGAFDRRGHGRTRDTDAPFSYSSMADELIAYLELVGRPCHVLGHSDGANTALVASLRRPDLIARQVLVGANYNFAGLMPLPPFEEDSPSFVEWAASFGALSPDGEAHARAVFRKTAELHRTQPTLTRTDLATVAVPTLVMAGDDDVATLTHTASLYESIPGSQLAIIPGTSHSVLKEASKLSVRIIRRFLDSELPVVTRYPLRRQVELEQ